MKLPIILVVIGVFVFYLIVPMCIWFSARNSKTGKVLTTVFAILYVIILFFGITSRIFFKDSIAIIEIGFSTNWCDKVINFSLVDIDKIDLLINLIMLIPVGLVVVYFNRRTLINRFIMLFVIGVIFGIGLETLQFVLPVSRSVQLSDAILNTISVVMGGILGILYDCVIKYKSRNK